METCQDTMAAVGTNNADQEQEQNTDNTLFNDPPLQPETLDNSNNNNINNKASSRNKSGRKKQSAQRNAKKVVSLPPQGSASSTVSGSCSIILEDGKDMPVFWNGENSMPLVKWCSTLEHNGNKLVFDTIDDFLSNYAAGKYLRKCSMSLQATSTKYIDNLRISDPFYKLFDHCSRDGKPVTLLLTHANDDNNSASGYAKFLLHIRELNGKKVLWNGSIPTNRIVAKLNQSDMSLKIENLLQNYIPKGYLSQNCQVDLVKECSGSGTIRTTREELSTISTNDLVNTLFKGNSASIVIRSGVTSTSESCKDNSALQTTGKELQDMSPSSTTKIPVFKSPPQEECHWIGMTWGGIKEDVMRLVNCVELTMRDTILTTDSYATVLEKKRSLETAIRRRTRIVDEVWRCYLVLQTAHADLLNGQTIQGQSSSGIPFQTVRILRRTGGDVDNELRAQRSCLDFLSSTLIRYGMELELYDEESQALSRVGVGVGLAAAVIIIGAVVYYY